MGLLASTRRSRTNERAWKGLKLGMCTDPASNPALADGHRSSTNDTFQYCTSAQALPPEPHPSHPALLATLLMAQALPLALLMTSPPHQPCLDCFTGRYCCHLATCIALVALPPLHPTVRPVFVPQASMDEGSRSRSASPRSAVVGRGRAADRAGRSGTGWVGSCGVLWVFWWRD